MYLIYQMKVKNQIQKSRYNVSHQKKVKAIMMKEINNNN